MLTILKTVTPSPEQWEIIIEGARNPMNSWNLMDSYITHIEDPETLETASYEFVMGEKDERLLKTLSSGRASDAKYRRMIPVYMTINAPIYWWKEFDTYKVGTVRNSCSTMHKIHAKEFCLEDFSTEHLFGRPNGKDYVEMFVDETITPLDALEVTINVLNHSRNRYLECNEELKRIHMHEGEDLVSFKEKRDAMNQLAKSYWWDMIQLLPTSYNQTATVMLNYENLHAITKDRSGHKLDEWHTFIEHVATLPHANLFLSNKLLTSLAK